MNLRAISDFLQRRSIRAAVFLLVAALVLYLVAISQGHDKAALAEVKPEPQTTAARKKSGPEGSVVETLKDDPLKEIKPAQPSGSAPAPASVPAGQAGPTGAHPSKHEEPIDNIPMSSLAHAEKAKVSDDFAPYGRFIEGTLRTTIMSSQIETPVVIVVTRPVYFRGKLIVAAGSTVHCTASKGRENNRVYVQPKVLVNEFTGEEMPVKGQILTRNVSISADGQKTWGLYDSTPGVLGEIIKTDNMAEIKLFIATFASAFIQAQETTYQNSVTGQQVAQNNAQNAALAGSAAVVNRYADQLLESIKRDGFFVLVPSGRDVWIYTEQTLDAGDYTVGSSRLSERKEARK